MTYKDQLEKIEISNRIFACKSQKRAMERELVEVQFRYNGIPAKRVSARESFYKTGIVSILLSLVIVYCLKLLIPIFVEIFTSGLTSKIGGIVIILVLPGTLLGSIACYKLWQRTLRLKGYLMGLKREEPYLQNKINNMKTQIRQLGEEIEELLEKQKEDNEEPVAVDNNIIV